MNLSETATSVSSGHTDNVLDALYFMTS